MKSLLMSLMFLSVAAEAVLSSTTATKTISSLTDFSAVCHPGIEPNGRNFPTGSMVTLKNLLSVIPVANFATEVTALDRRLGDHCSSLLSEIQAALPTEMTVERVVRDENRFRNGICVRRIEETIRAQFAGHRFYGSSEMIIEELPRDVCK